MRYEKAAIYWSASGALHHLMNCFIMALSLLSSPPPSPSISNRFLMTSSVEKRQKLQHNHHKVITAIIPRYLHM